MKSLNEVIEKLKELKAIGYIKTHRRGSTGIGKTLEDFLGIEENNVALPNTTFAEVKSARKGAQEMLTLFTKSPSPPKANTKLLDKYGYITPESSGRKILHTTTYATKYNLLRGQPGFKVQVTSKEVALISAHGEKITYWDGLTLKSSLERKLHHLLYVLADWRGKGSKEEFWFNEMWLLSDSNFNSFMEAIAEGVICIDTRIGQYPNGRTHDHGTGFRILSDKLALCFSQIQRII